ncbi:MAG: hypothetical protein JW394_0769 [Nitrospira sp.]|nr:hypothetical protein [Nitrospira sp.]
MTPNRQEPADTIPIDEGPLKTFPSLLAWRPRILASFSGTPSVIIETTLICVSSKASIPPFMARSAPI